MKDNCLYHVAPFLKTITDDKREQFEKYFQTAPLWLLESITVEEMKKGIKVGDRIATIGGIIGIVVSENDERITIETGADRNRMQITRWAVQQNVTATERVKAEREAAKAAAEKAKADKKAAKGKKDAE